MKLKYKNQKFQSDAARAVVDVFRGQCNSQRSYLINPGVGQAKLDMFNKGWGNAKIDANLTDDVILHNLQEVQGNNGLEPDLALDGRYNLTIEMETGVGKTYTYIKTMYELNKHYGWSKFIVVVPSIAIREGVYKSFQTTQEHFAETYNKKIRYFIYNSDNLSAIDNFASDNNIHVMIVNSQAFNARGKNQRKIYDKLDSFNSRRPIDVIASTNPILIIDEPQSVEGKKTKEGLRDFNALFTLRYSATHRPDSLYNMVYRLDAVDAYQKRLVKKITVKGITEAGSTATNSYVHCSKINITKGEPTATIEIDCKGKTGVRKKTCKVKTGDNLYSLSNEMQEYKDNFVVKPIDARTDMLEFLNGVSVPVGDVIGDVDEDQIRRIQIRETIKSHLDRERELFKRGIKVLSLFFIDEVANYRQYDESGQEVNGKYAEMLEEEYEAAVAGYQEDVYNQEYFEYLQSIEAAKTHAGYFSIDKHGNLINGKTKGREGTSDDVSAYELIMKNKEHLLERDPHKSPVRFIFSHSALREGWDNPNVFQICTLKQSSAEVRKRQEVGRGMRLCVDQDGIRQDESVVGESVHNINVLTVIASESYESFARSLQTEIAEAVANRPKTVEDKIFVDKVFHGENDDTILVDLNMSRKIFYSLIRHDYVDDEGKLTSKYHSEKDSELIDMPEDFKPYDRDIVTVLNQIFDPDEVKPEDAYKNNVELKFSKEKFAKKEFRELWGKINAKSTYRVEFNTDELVQKAIKSINEHLSISKVYFTTEKGSMQNIESKQQLQEGSAFSTERIDIYEGTSAVSSQIKYDLIGEIVALTTLTRKAVAQILHGIDAQKFEMFKNNPDDFIIKISKLINEAKGTTVIEHIKYIPLDEAYEEDIFTENTIKAKLGENAVQVENSLYDYVVYDSINEKELAEDLDNYSNVSVYVKLPNGFKIPTPVGNYNPDWAIAFKEASTNIKHIYFVAETKGSMESTQLRSTEDTKIKCARKHFQDVVGTDISYGVIDCFDTLLNKVIK